MNHFTSITKIERVLLRSSREYRILLAQHLEYRSLRLLLRGTIFILYPSVRWSPLYQHERSTACRPTMRTRHPFPVPLHLDLAFCLAPFNLVYQNTTKKNEPFCHLHCHHLRRVHNNKNDHLSYDGIRIVKMGVHNSEKKRISSDW